jgi:pseudaminic acid biosynthesis-associated methylase
LEVGCNIGNQLLVLQTMGYTNLSGIELNAESAQLARERTGCPIIQGSATNLPFKNKSFDLVFTSGVLIHINPSEQVTAMSEIARVSKKWIWLLEYYSENLTEVEYRGKESLLWKNNFAKLYETFTGAMLKDEILLENIGSDNLDQMALLEVAE